jgi:hypothetical protein
LGFFSGGHHFCILYESPRCSTLWHYVPLCSQEVIDDIHVDEVVDKRSDTCIWARMEED